MSDRAGMEARLVALAAALPEVNTDRSRGEVSWSAAGHPFAILTDDAVEIRLTGPVAAAAGNTPDTQPSPRGVGWVRFRPAMLDGHAIDRLEAWFAFGRRHAAEAGGPAAAAQGPKSA